MIKHLLFVSLIFSFSFSLTYEEVENLEKKEGTLKALSYYKQLARQEDTKAIFRLAIIHLKGIEIQQNIEAAHDLLLKAATLKDKKSAYYLAKLYLNRNSSYFNLTKAYNIFLELSQADYAPAQNMIGKFLLNGIAIEKDYKLAVKYFEAASKQGYTEAHCNLAFMYASGKGVFPNFGRANVFASEGMKKNHALCKKVYEDFNLANYPEDKSFKFNFYTKPN